MLIYVDACLDFREMLVHQTDWRTCAEEGSSPAQGDFVYVQLSQDMNWYRAKVAVVPVHPEQVTLHQCIINNAKIMQDHDYSRRQSIRVL